ncbi:MAG: serine hydrolase domain-containing protein [Eubacteriales bacterium]|nr:serine hydrolase domain-containing protein [Eubacteriales bacterium]
MKVLLSDKKRALILLVLCSLLIQLLPLRLQAVAGTEVELAELSERIDTFINEHESSTAGLALRYFDSDELLIQRDIGYVDRERGLKVDSKTVMEWGSITKPLVFLSVMQLVEEGVLDLNQDIRKYLPEGFLEKLNFPEPISLVHLMNHSGGFADRYVELVLQDPNLVKDLGTALKEHQPEQIYPPGKLTAYSNWGVALAGYIVELQSKLPFSEYVRQNIFAACGMEHSAIAFDSSDNPWVQEQRMKLKYYDQNAKPNPHGFNYLPLYPCGSTCSTAEDLARFGQAILRRDPKLLKQAESWDLYLSPSAYYGSTELPSNYHGFWVFPFAKPIIGHSGNAPGSSANLLLDLEAGRGLVVMTNQKMEKPYNHDLPKLVFGEFAEDLYFKEARHLPEGVYRAAQTVRSGPFKINSLNFIFGRRLKDDFWLHTKLDGFEKIAMPRADYIRISAFEFAFEISLILLWLCAIIFALVSLLRALYSYLVKGRKTAFLKLLPALLEMIIVLALLHVLYRTSIFDLRAKYFYLSSSIIALATLLMIALVCRDIYMSKTGKLKEAPKFTSIFFQVITIINVIYWNLFMFWKI